MMYRVRKEAVVASMEVVMDEQAQPQCVPTSYTFQYAVQVKGFLRWHTIKTFSKIRAAAKFLRSLKEKLTDEV